MGRQRQRQHGGVKHNEAAEGNQCEYQFSKAAEIVDRLGLMANRLTHVGHTHNAGGGELQPTCCILPCTVRIDCDRTSSACEVKKRNH